ncbi:hypothetical protein K435DRAFT_857718 [Dendrothele bispora CBS 962.96]|uniref:Uncharacterized protein n=1 Tax=Dendrothele bispora (strain CBS 962.96) TaxID=1314807 RepID=A0A4S8M6C3_DENBC|nr:hypothetical protein K435DRAFT_857718 [Dendrothele bispora CBS 962.96]
MPSLVSGSYPNGQIGLDSDTNAFDVVIEPVLVVNDKQLLLISTTTSITPHPTKTCRQTTPKSMRFIPMTSRSLYQKELSSLLLSDRSSVLCPDSQLFSIVEPYLVYRYFVNLQ